MKTSLAKWATLAAMLFVLFGCNKADQSASNKVDQPASKAADNSIPDLSSPKSTLKSYLKAVRNQDRSSAKKCVLDDADHQKMIDFSFSIMGVTKALRNKFPDYMKITGTLEPFSEDDIQSATEEISGDKAIVKVKDNPIKLNKIGGDWKLDLPVESNENFYRLSSEEITKRLNQVADEINAGKYKSLEEATIAERNALER